MDIKIASNTAINMGYDWIAMDVRGEWYAFKSEPIINLDSYSGNTWIGEDMVKIGSASMVEWPKQPVLTSKTCLKL